MREESDPSFPRVLDKARVESFLLNKTGVDELMVATAVYDHSARIKSYELLAQI